MDSNEATPWWLNNTNSQTFVKYLLHMYMKLIYEDQGRTLWKSIHDNVWQMEEFSFVLLLSLSF